MGADREYIIANCKDKQTMYGIDICMVQTEPCMVAIERNRCPSIKVWESVFMRGEDDETD